MTPHTANRINAFVLIILSLWAYLATTTSYWPALVPAGFGVALLACSPGVKTENKVIAHVAVLLTLVVFFLLMVPFISTLGKGDWGSAIRVSVMLITCIVAMVAFIKSFREARRQRSL